MWGQIPRPERTGGASFPLCSFGSSMQAPERHSSPCAHTDPPRRFLPSLVPDVMNVEQARIAEEAGACAVMALERIPADIRVQGGVARASDPALIKAIQAAVTIPVRICVHAFIRSEDGGWKLHELGFSVGPSFREPSAVGRMIVD